MIKEIKTIAKSETLQMKRIDSLSNRASNYIDQARLHVQHTIDNSMIKAYWLIGREIVEEEQFGKEQSEYGTAILKGLSIRLQRKYKKGFSVDLLEKMRKFYLIYHIDSEKSATVSRKSVLPLVPNLSWSHYIELIKITRSEARQFYALEAIKNNWNVRELRQQISSFLFDRLSKSKDKKKLLEMVNRGHEISTPEDAIKDPLVLNFLGAPEPHTLSETNLETALIDNLEEFLRELGKGFAYVGR